MDHTAVFSWYPQKSLQWWQCLAGVENLQVHRSFSRRGPQWLDVNTGLSGAIDACAE
jgi:hypothetical protein